MPEGLDVIIIDDDPDVCEVLTEIVKRFIPGGMSFPFQTPTRQSNTASAEKPEWRFLSWISSWAGKAASSFWI